MQGEEDARTTGSNTSRRITLPGMTSSPYSRPHSGSCASSMLKQLNRKCVSSSAVEKRSLSHSAKACRKARSDASSRWTGWLRSLRARAGSGTVASRVTRESGRKDAQALDERLEAQVDEEGPGVGAGPCAHLGDLEVRQLADELVRRRVDRAAAGVADDERLGRLEVEKVAQGRRVDGCRLGLAACAGGLVSSCRRRREGGEREGRT